MPDASPIGNRQLGAGAFGPKVPAKKKVVIQVSPGKEKQMAALAKGRKTRLKNLKDKKKAAKAAANPRK